MLCGWEGNCRSGVALAMRHTQWSTVYPPELKGQCAGDEHPTYAPLEHGPFTLLPPLGTEQASSSESDSISSGASKRADLGERELITGV